MEINEDDKIELNTILKIVINQVPNYYNLINPSSQDWEIQKIDDFVFGMVFNSFIAKSTEYLKNKLIDSNKNAKLEENSEYFELAINFFNSNVPEVKEAISQRSHPND